MSKRKQEPQIVFTPVPLDADAYVVTADVKESERAALRLAWSKMNAQAGTNKALIITPSHIQIEYMPTPVLRELIGTLMEALGKRGEFDRLRKDIDDVLVNGTGPVEAEFGTL